MDAPQFLAQAAEGWAHLYSKTKMVSTAVTYVHLAGLLLGGGAAVAADRETLKAFREPEAVRADHLDFLGSVHSIAITGLVMLAVSGALMFFADLDTFWASKIFWTKMGLVLLLLANGLVMRQAEQMAGRTPQRAWLRLRATSLVSAFLWFVVLMFSVVLATSA